MTRIKSARFKKFGILVACGPLLAVSFFAGRFSVNRISADMELLQTSRNSIFSDNHSASPLAYDFAVPIARASTNDRQIFSFQMGLTR